MIHWWSRTVLMSLERMRTTVCMTWSVFIHWKNDIVLSTKIISINRIAHASSQRNNFRLKKNMKKKKNKLWSNYIGRAACRCLFTSAIPRLLNMRSLTCSHFAPQPVQPSLVALVEEIPQHPPCRCLASCGRSINIEQRQTGLPPASHSHNSTPEVAPVTERRRAFQS